MPTYMFAWNGPIDIDVSRECGVALTSDAPDPPLTKNYTFANANDLAVVEESLGFRGWTLVGEVTP